MSVIHGLEKADLMERSRRYEQHASNARYYADHLRAQAKEQGTATPHCCGAAGFRGAMYGDICPGCEDRAESK